jgi:hypothetical protein
MKVTLMKENGKEVFTQAIVQYICCNFQQLQFENGRNILDEITSFRDLIVFA